MATSSIFISSLPTSSVILDTAAFPLDQSGNTYQVTGNLMLQGLYTASSVNNIINTIITPNFNSFTSSYKTDSSSFNTQISTLSSSYRTDSSSFNLRIISGSQSLNTYSSSIGVISSSFDNRIITTSQSLSTLSSSYRTDSSSFNLRIISGSQSLNTYSSSIGVISSSFDQRINNSSTFLQNKTVYVEINGNDSTAVLGNPNRPARTINKALQMLSPNGGNIKIGIGSFDAPSTSNIISNINFLGSGQPITNNSVTSTTDNGNVNSTIPTSLINGTIILGTFIIPSTINSVIDKVIIKDLGVDVGNDYCNLNNIPDGADGLIIPAFYDGVHHSATGMALRNGVVIENVICLLRSSTSTGGIVLRHGLLVELCYEPIVNNIKVYYGFAGFITKNNGGNYNNINCYGNSYYGIYIKDSVYAHNNRSNLNNFIVDSIDIINKDCGGGIVLSSEIDLSPWSGGSTSLYNINISNGNINNIKDKNAIYYECMGYPSVQSIQNFNISNLIIDNINSDAIVIDAVNINLNNINIKNVIGNGIKLLKSKSDWGVYNLNNIIINSCSLDGLNLNSSNNNYFYSLNNISCINNIGKGFNFNNLSNIKNINLVSRNNLGDNNEYERYLLSSSYKVDSSSFDQRIITTSQSLNTYTPTSSFNTLSQSIQLYDSEISIYSTGSTPPILGTDYNINNKILNIINNNKFSIKYPELYNIKWGQTSQTTGYFSSFLLSGSVIFAGSGNGIYSSSNGGVTWSQTSQNTGNFYSLLLSGSVIFAGSQNNGIYSSSNGGNTWSQTSQNTGTFNSLILSGSVIFVGSQNNGIYSSSNGGVTWGQTSLNTGTFLSFLLSGSVIFAGSGNGIYLSSNGGNTWSQTSQTTGNFSSFLLSGSVIFAGSGNGIYLSSNGGNIWSQTSQNTGTFRAFLLSGSVIFAGSGNGIYSSSNGGVTWSQTSQNTGNFYSLLLSGSVIFAGSQNNGIYSSSLSLNSIYENKIYISNNTSSVVGTLPITDNNAYKVDSSSFDLRIISSSLAMRDVVIPFYTANPLYTTPVSGSDYNIVNNNIINTAFPLMSTIPIYGKYDNITFNNNIPNTLLYPNGLGLNIGLEPILKYNNSNDKYYFAPYNNIGNGATRNSGSIFIVSSSFNYSDTLSYTQSNFKYSIGDLSGSTSKYLKSPTAVDQISSIFITGSEILATSLNTLSDKNVLWYSNDNGLNFTSIINITSSLNTYKISNLSNIRKNGNTWFISTWYSNTSYNNTVPITLYNIHTSSILTDSWTVANATLSKQIASHENFQSGITGSLTWVYVRGHAVDGTNPFILTSPNNINWTQKSDIKTALNGLNINIPNFYDSCTYISNFNTFIINILDLNNNPLYNIYSKDGGNSWNKYNIYVNPLTLEVTNNYSGNSNCEINDGFYSSELNSYITGGTYILKTQDGINFSLVSKNPNFRGKIALGKNNVLLNNVETITNGITTSSIYQSSISSIYKTNVYFSNLKQQPNNSKLELFSNYGNTYQLTGTPPSSFTWDIVLYSTVYISNQLTTPINFYLTNIDSYVNTYNNNIELNLIFNISNAIPTINFYNSSLITINTSNGGGTTEHSTWQYVKYNFIYNNGNIIGFSQRL